MMSFAESGILISCLLIMIYVSTNVSLSVSDECVYVRVCVYVCLWEESLKVRGLCPRSQCKGIICQSTPVRFLLYVTLYARTNQLLHFEKRALTALTGGFSKNAALNAVGISVCIQCH